MSEPWVRGIFHSPALYDRCVSECMDPALLLLLRGAQVLLVVLFQFVFLHKHATTLSSTQLWWGCSLPRDFEDSVSPATSVFGRVAKIVWTSIPRIMVNVCYFCAVAVGDRWSFSIPRIAHRMKTLAAIAATISNCRESHEWLVNHFARYLLACFQGWIGFGTDLFFLVLPLLNDQYTHFVTLIILVSVPPGLALCTLSRRHHTTSEALVYKGHIWTDILR